MAELFGMTGKIVRVDLTTETVTVIEPEEEVYRKFLGGTALGAYFLVKEGIADPSVDPLGPDNLLQFMIGPVTGAAANARVTVVTQKPLQLLLCFDLRRLCCCGIEIGWLGWYPDCWKSLQTCLSGGCDDDVEIRDASHVWGMGVEEAEMILKSEVHAEMELREGMIRDADLTPEWTAMRPPKRLGMHAKRLAQSG